MVLIARSSVAVGTAVFIIDVPTASICRILEVDNILHNTDLHGGFWQINIERYPALGVVTVDGEPSQNRSNDRPRSETTDERRKQKGHIHHCRSNNWAETILRRSKPKEHAEIHQRIWLRNSKTLSWEWWDTGCKHWWWREDPGAAAMRFHIWCIRPVGGCTTWGGLLHGKRSGLCSKDFQTCTRSMTDLLVAEQLWATFGNSKKSNMISALHHTVPLEGGSAEHKAVNKHVGMIFVKRSWMLLLVCWQHTVWALCYVVMRLQSPVAYLCKFDYIFTAMFLKPHCASLDWDKTAWSDVGVVIFELLSFTSQVGVLSFTPQCASVTTYLHLWFWNHIVQALIEIRQLVLSLELCCLNYFLFAIPLCKLELFYVTPRCASLTTYSQRWCWNHIV